MLSMVSPAVFRPMTRTASLLSALAAALALTACAQPQSAPAAPAGTCNAQPARFAVGYTLTDALTEEVKHRSGARVARVLRPGQVTTMEFSSERVNLDVDAGNRVTGVRCG